MPMRLHFYLNITDKRQRYDDDDDDDDRFKCVNIFLFLSSDAFFDVSSGSVSIRFYRCDDKTR